MFPALITFPVIGWLLVLEFEWLVLEFGWLELTEFLNAKPDHGKEGYDCDSKHDTVLDSELNNSG